MLVQALWLKALADLEERTILDGSGAVTGMNPLQMFSTWVIQIPKKAFEWLAWIINLGKKRPHTSQCITHSGHNEYRCLSSD